MAGLMFINKAGKFATWIVANSAFTAAASSASLKNNLDVTSLNSPRRDSNPTYCSMPLKYPSRTTKRDHGDPRDLDSLAGSARSSWPYKCSAYGPRVACMMLSTESRQGYDPELLRLSCCTRA